MFRNKLHNRLRLFIFFSAVFHGDVLFFYLSNEKTGPNGCLGDLFGDEILPSYKGFYFINREIRIPIKLPGFNGFIIYHYQDPGSKQANTMESKAGLFHKSRDIGIQYTTQWFKSQGTPRPGPRRFWSRKPNPVENRNIQRLVGLVKMRSSFFVGELLT